MSRNYYNSNNNILDDLEEDGHIEGKENDQEDNNDENEINEYTEAHLLPCESEKKHILLMFG